MNDCFFIKLFNNNNSNNNNNKNNNNNNNKSNNNNNNNKGIYKISSKIDFFILNGKLKGAAI